MFLNPLMLAGLGGAAIPLVLHLLSRARYLRIDFGAMMFLTSAPGRIRHGTRLKQLVLLLIRMAAVALLAVALARPVSRSGALPIGESGRVTAVIILDRSASMAFEANGRTSMDQAKLALLNVLSNLRRGDSASLIMTGDRSGESIPPTTDLQLLAGKVDELQPSFGRADMTTALMQAARVFQADSNPNRELYIICDRQALGWNGVDEPFVAAWANAVARDGRRPRSFILPVGAEHASNVAIESLRLIGPPVVRGQPAEIEVRIHNYDSTPRSAVPLTITSVNGRELYRDSCNLKPNATTVLSARVPFTAAGSQVITCRIQTAGFKADDQVELAVDVLDPVKVLIIGAPQDQGRNDVLPIALAPFRAAGESGVDPAVVSSFAHNQDLSTQRPDVIILDNVPMLSAEKVRALEQFVYTGGGLLVAPGGLSQVENYNRLLFKEYTGLMPARLIAPAPPDAAPPTTVATVDNLHPIFQFLTDRKLGLPGVSVSRHFPTVDRVGARVLASYASGEPMLIDRDYGRGHVILMTTSPDGEDWNDLPGTNLFLPLMQSMVRWLARPEQPPRNLTIGQPIEALISEPIRARTGRLTLPGGAVRNLELAAAGQGSQLRFSETQLPGRYTLRVPLANGDDLVSYFVVQAPLDEADPAQLTSQQWQWLGQMLSAQRIDSSDKTVISAAIGSRRTGREIFLPVLAIVAGLILTETVLTTFWVRATP